MRDQPGGGGKDRRRRPVVRLQPDDMRTLEILFEAQDVFHLRPAPGVDRLVVVADAADVAVALGEQTQPHVLHQVGVLILVHQDVAEPAMVVGQDVRLGPQDLRHVQQQVAEIRRVQRPQPGLVRGIKHLGMAVGEVGILVRGNPRRRQPTVFPALDHAHQRRRGPPLGVDPLRLHHLLQQPKLVVGVEDGEIRRQPDMLRVPPQHPRAQRMKSPKPKAFRRLAQQRGNTFPHFPRGLVGERNGQHLVRERAPRQQDVGKPRGQHPGLAGARAGEHQQRPVDGFNRRPLLWVQARQVVGGEGRFGCHGLDIGQFPPD